MTECTHCEADLPEGLLLCNAGADDLRRVLGRVRDVLNTAGGTLANQAVAPPPAGGGGGSTAPGLPYSLDMSDRVRDYQETIRHWARMLGEGHAETLKPGESITVPLDTIAAAVFIRERMGMIRGNEHANTILQELRMAERSVINAADRQAPKLLLGECGTLQWVDDKIEPCPGQIIGREGDDQARCDTCRGVHSARERVEAKVSRAWHVVAPLRQVVHALKAYGIHVKYDTAKSWARRGKIGPVCDINTGTEGYTPAAVLNAMPTKVTTASNI